MLDYTAPSTVLGKPTNADLALGLATAPVLFAWRDYPELGPMIKRKFEDNGDVEKVLKLIRCIMLMLGSRVSCCVRRLNKNEGFGDGI